MNVNINDIKNGMTLILEGKLVTIVDFQSIHFECFMDN